MGGRGSSTGISTNGKTYGTEYKSLLTSGNVKFVVRLDNSATAPMETMTKNRVYVTLSPQGNPKFISYYDRANKRNKQIDLDKPHNGLLPHTHHGYEHKENDTAKGFANLTDKERTMVLRVQQTWEEKIDVVWTRWQKRKQNELE